MAEYIIVSNVRKLVKLKGKRVSAEFLNALDLKVQKMVEDSCAVHNGGKVTLDNTIACHVFGTTGRA